MPMWTSLYTVGEDTSDAGNILRCHTNLESCCTSQGVHRGDWYFPDGNVLGNAGGGDDIHRRRDIEVVHLCRTNDATSPSGIYRCDIETVAVNDNDVDAITGETVYVGLYPPNGGNVILFLAVVLLWMDLVLHIHSVILYIRRYYHT